MLSQVNFWAERAAMVMDLALMIRILMLKLHRTYLFVALFVLLSLFYDGVGLLMGTETEDFGRVVVMSKFLYAAVFPLAIWDLFEEAKPTIEKVRKLAMTRMISSLIFITLWGLLIAAFTGGEAGDQSHYFIRLAFVMWTGSIAAALAFLWVMKRGIRANQWQLPHNTSVWFLYFRVLLIIESGACLLFLILPSAKALGSTWTETASAVSAPILQGCAIALTVWCIFKLRAVPAEPAGVSAHASS